MTDWVAAAFLVVGFVVLIRLFRLAEWTREVVDASRRSIGVIRSRTLSDDEKEAALKKDAGLLFRLSFILLLGGAAAFLLPIALMWFCDWVGFISLASMLDVALSPVFLVTSGIVVILVLWLGAVGKQAGSEYSAMDRLLHRIAFKTTAAQISLADFEDRLFSKDLVSCTIQRPIFITALPRAGTTLLLECCARMPEFATHCYRDMPFILIPCLWNRFSARFRRAGEARERAHGDGMMIDYDSPEALEEVVWKAFWRRHYLSDRIIPWQDEQDDEFDEFLRSHMRKIILVRRGRDPQGVRYVSKNNLNVARVGMLRSLFADSIILVLFRQPLQHAASLLRQHMNFLRIHEKDRFACEYMRAIGHYEFGRNLRPVDFDGWLNKWEPARADSLAFWLEYWVACYRYLLARSTDAVSFLSYDALCAEPESSLRRIADTLEISEPEPFLSAAAGISQATPREADTSGLPASLIKEANRIHDELKQAALHREVPPNPE